MREKAIDLQQERVLVVVQPGWHHGVIGIVASRLVERYGVPVFIGTFEDDEGGQGQPSASSSAAPARPLKLSGVRRGEFLSLMYLTG